MRGKYLVEESSGNVKNNSDNDISSCLVVQPVHQQNKWDNADHKIHAVYPASLNKIALIIVTYSC